MTKRPQHLSPDEFRTQGYAFIDWISQYYQDVPDFPVTSRVAPGQVSAQLPASAPEEGEGLEHVLNDMNRVIVPGLTHWASPNFFAYFPS